MRFVYAISAVIAASICYLLVPVQAAAPPPSTTTTQVIVTTTSTTTTVPEPLPAGVPDDKSKRCPQFESKFAAHGLYPVQVFSYIAWRESGCRPRAINARWDSAGNIIWTLNRNGTYDSGLLQVNSSWKTVTRKTCGGDISMLLTLDCNLRVAKYLLDNGGLGHWSL
ncbi:hypothetical protein UFOVP1387_47 [uncultured Caudovirales phage]|jgi:hypothetical protein|uniref:Transglycosylase SLT domain 1 n=1 Tax=uncultured Caudovirales phage TaxID=2100421 RepID=A0A6J5S6J1_9CAUD|nr:hypothetical protein UFOVP1387_47 [uncultured Caudovirales phage]